MSLIDSLEADVQHQLRASAPAPRPEPPAGIYLQIYRDAVRGPTPQAKRAQLARYCDEIARMGLPGVVFHGFPGELLAAWDGLAQLAADRGLLALASWGLDGRDRTAAAKGDLVGQILARPSCAAGLLDAEGQWDSDRGHEDDMDEAGARALCSALRARAPGAWVGDQCWPQMELHARRTTRQGPSGPILGFPVDEFAAVTNWGRFRQLYLEAGSPPYQVLAERMDRQWASLTPTLRAAGLERPLRVTLQAYGWPHLHDQVHALLDRGVRTGDPIVLWCDPWPDATCLRAIRAVLWMQREGYACGGIRADYAVRFAQAKLRVDVDGDWGEETARAAGLW